MTGGRRHSEPEPFTIAIPDHDLADLRTRLRNTRWANDAGNADWGYGVERSWLQDMVRYWAEDFDWRAQEKQINDFPNYKVEIDGVPIHFVHAKGPAGTRSRSSCRTDGRGRSGTGARSSAR
jgi:Epoxide hydrolase N terminus.